MPSGLHDVTEGVGGTPVSPAPGTHITRADPDFMAAVGGGAWDGEVRLLQEERLGAGPGRKEVGGAAAGEVGGAIAGSEVTIPSWPRSQAPSSVERKWA